MSTYHPAQSVTVLALALLAAPAPSQEVRWRHDYRAAREEARATGRPLVLDFETDNCLWCRRLDATTFRDPTIAGLLNDAFVPLKVDAGRYPGLTRALHIECFPTILFAAPDGRILDQLTGYADASAFHGRLRRALAEVSPPDAAAQDYQEAASAIAAADYPRAIALLRRAVRDGQSRPVQLRAQQLLGEFERQAAERLRSVRELEGQGQRAEAGAALAELVRVFEGTAAAREASRLLSAQAR